MVIALHGIILEHLRQQLVDGVAQITPLPPPLLMHVLQPVAKPAPQPQPPPKKVQVKARAGPPVDSLPQEPAPGPEDAPLTEPAPMPENAASAEVVGVSDVADVASADPPLAPEPPAEPVAVPDAWPVDTRLSYSVKGYYRGDYYGWGQVQWQHSDGRYQVQVDMRLAFIFTGTLISQGELTADGLQPRVYEERRMGRVQNLRLDGSVVTFHDGRTLSQPPGLQDTASQFVELTHRFSSGRQILVVGQPVSLWLARPREMHLWTYDVVALETLQLPELGEVPAFHLKPRPLANPRGVINAELWFAPGLQYLPVRIRINLGADNYAEMTVKRIEQAAPPVNVHP